jgi:hypothetical protein
MGLSPVNTEAQDIHDALAAAGTTIVSAPVDGPFGRAFADPGPVRRSRPAPWASSPRASAKSSA